MVQYPAFPATLILHSSPGCVTEPVEPVLACFDPVKD